VNCRLGRTWLDEANPAATREPVIAPSLAKSRVRLCLLGPAAIHAQEHRAAPADFRGFGAGGQSDFTKWLRAYAMEDCHVTEPYVPQAFTEKSQTSSVSDSLCITDSARIYSSGIYADVKTTHVSQALTSAAMSESLTRTATTVLKGTGGFGGGRRSTWSVGDPRVRLSHRENAGDYPPYKLKLSTYIVSFSPFTDLHFILTFLPACGITLSWLAILNT
jgi:hypothetical protein